MKKRSYLFISLLIFFMAAAWWFLKKDTGEKVQNKEHPTTSNEHEGHHDDEAQPEHDEAVEHGHAEEAAHEDEHSEHEEHDEHGDDGHGETSGGVGPNNAVTAADEHDGIKLSPKAIEVIGLKTAAYDGQVPASALVFYQNNSGVYRLKEDWFKLVPVSNLGVGDQIVIQGTGLLRVADLDAFSGEVGHGH